jgi:hypothetical protein
MDNIIEDSNLNILSINEKIIPLCLCGCGNTVKIGRDSHKYNKYILGHYWNRKKLHSETIQKLSQIRTGKKLSNEQKLFISNLHKGKIISNQTRFKISEKNKGKIKTKETRLKLSISGKGKHGNPHTLETKIKMSISAIKRIQKNGVVMFPGIGKNEILILDKIQNSIGINFSRNNYELFLKTGKFCDGYSFQYNFDLEIDEPYHYNIDGSLKKKDQERDLLIASKLSCIIYRIKEQEFLSNPEKEIHKLNDFINILKDL